MRKNVRRRDVNSAAKFQEVRNIKNAFGEKAAKRFCEEDFLDPALLQAALSARHERRRRLRRAMDCPVGTDSFLAVGKQE